MVTSKQHYLPYFSESVHYGTKHSYIHISTFLHIFCQRKCLKHHQSDVDLHEYVR